MFPLFLLLACAGGDTDPSATDTDGGVPYFIPTEGRYEVVEASGTDECGIGLDNEDYWTYLALQVAGADASGFAMTAPETGSSWDCTLSGNTFGCDTWEETRDEDFGPILLTTTLSGSFDDAASMEATWDVDIDCVDDSCELPPGLPCASDGVASYAL